MAAAPPSEAQGAGPFPEVFAQQVEKIVMEIVHPWLDYRLRRQVVERSLPPLDEQSLLLGRAFGQKTGGCRRFVARASLHEREPPHTVRYGLSGAPRVEAETVGLDAHGTRGYGADRSALEPLLTIREVCAALAISRQTLYRLLKTGDLVAIRVSQSSPRFRPSEIQDYLDQRKGVMR